MRELNDNEIQATQGAGIILETFEDLLHVIRRLPVIYDAAINSTADMMCRGSGRC